MSKPAAPAANNAQKLPPKFDGMFKQLVKQYEGKHYKKALKTAQDVLKVHPEHGETIAMKGLVLSCLEKKLWGDQTPHGLAKEGLSKNLRSHVCWHVFGLLHRGDRNYVEAVKCYRQAIRLDPENLQILRDLATLQTQIRDVSGLIETRGKLLELKSTAAQNWLGMAVAHHLAGNHEVAFLVLKAFESATEKNQNKVEISELQLYKAQILMDGKDFAGALKCLQESASKVVDQSAYLTMKSECELQTGDKTAAASTCIQLLELNPNCPVALKAYVKSKASFAFETDFKDPALTPPQRKELLDILDAVGATVQSKNMGRVCLDLATGDDLRRRIEFFAKPYVRSNIPSLFSALKSLYSNPQSVAVLESLFLEWKDELTKHGKFASDEHPNPTCLLWVLMFLSVHYLRINNITRAKELIEEAIAHSPTVETLYLIKAKILKHEGKSEEAAVQSDIARRLDLADRYLTNRCVKYHLRAKKLEEAETLYATFSRAKPNEVITNLVELQTMWYETELGDAYFQMGDLQSALQTYLLVDRHFADFKDDQSDFHSYCLRKYTLRSYMDMLKFHDNAQSNVAYQKAAKRIVRCYLEIALVNSADTIASRVCDHAKKSNALAEPPLGKVPALDKPLTDVTPYLNSILKYSANDVDTQTLAARVYIAKNQPVLAGKALLKACGLVKGSKSNADLVAAVKAFAALPTTGPVQQLTQEVLRQPDVKALL